MEFRLNVLLLLPMSVLLLTGCGQSTSGIPYQPPPTPPAVHNEWTWIGGSLGINQHPVYGTLGIPSANNDPGGRVNAVSWRDASGNFWLFGGYSLIEHTDLNDLWKYSNGEWTWMGGSSQPGQPGIYGTQGVAASANAPGARDNAASWTDGTGNFWLFGGIGVDSVGTKGNLNDLWRYSNGEWTWMSGSNIAAEPGLTGAYQGTGIYGTKGTAASSNLPGVRFAASSWADASGNLWLFGGEGVDSAGNLGILNDLWKYSNGEWAWMAGSDIGDGNGHEQYGVYGTLGTPNPANTPGARGGAATWTDPAGDLWLFGGDGEDVNGLRCQQTGSPCELNDLWKYNPAANEWTWMGGSNQNNSPGVYGAQGTAAPSNIPPPRDGAIAWTDDSGNFWFYGGNTTGGAVLDDLWKYSNGEWTWVSGSNLTCQTGMYGIQGQPASSNAPGARNNAVSWTDKAGNLWFFGGDDFCNGSGNYNDLWEYQP